MSKQQKTEFDLLLSQLGQSGKLLKATPAKAKTDAEEGEEEGEEEEEGAEGARGTKLAKGGAEGATAGDGEGEEEEEAEEGEEEGGEEEEEEAGQAEEGEEEEGADAGADKRLGKAIHLTDAKGKKIEAFDGFPLLKSLMASNKQLRQDGVGTKKLLKAVVENSTALTTSVTSLRKTLGELKKSVDNIANASRGRKSTLTMIGGDAKGQGGMKPEEFMGKCIQANAAGKLSGLEVSTANSYVNRGQMPPADLIRKVVAATAN